MPARNARSRAARQNALNRAARRGQENPTQQNQDPAARRRQNQERQNQLRRYALNKLPKFLNIFRLKSASKKVTHKNSEIKIFLSYSKICSELSQISVPYLKKFLKGL